jgi:AcrR family transcriptional regulator
LEATDKFKENKSEVIIKAAQARFGIYGFDKTSMREIAEDVNMSKGSLYYYFPDKENLYKVVIEKEQAEFLQRLEEDLKNIPDPGECLKKYTLARLSYFKTLLNLSRIRSESLNELKPLIAATFENFREKEKMLVMQILEKGKVSGQFNITSTYELASLFLDLLRGLRSASLNNKKLLVINDDEYEALSGKIMTFTDIFIRGVMF